MGHLLWKRALRVDMVSLFPIKVRANDFPAISGLNYWREYLTPTDEAVGRGRRRPTVEYDLGLPPPADAERSGHKATIQSWGRSLA
jgi:hypothetical protein